MGLCINGAIHGFGWHINLKNMCIKNQADKNCLPVFVLLPSMAGSAVPVVQQSHAYQERIVP